MQLFILQCFFSLFLKLRYTYRRIQHQPKRVPNLEIKTSIILIDSIPQHHYVGKIKPKCKPSNKVCPTCQFLGPLSSVSLSFSPSINVKLT